MLNTVRQKHWRKTQPWGLYKTQGGSYYEDFPSEGVVQMSSSGLRDSQMVASNFRSMINDLKRRPEDAARDLGISLHEVDAYLSGEMEITMALVQKAVEVWPVSPRDFFLLRDDCPNGVKIMRSAASKNSARVMARAGIDYYEYRDTAMSSVAAFRPEWIQELCVVEDDDPNNPLVQWNNGHFLHQFTYFIGPVNFYYRDREGNKRVAVMKTGDSMHISPFVPHTFTTRKNTDGRLGLILALTYSNKLGGEAKQELGLLGKEQAQKLVMNFDSPDGASGQLVRFHREGLSMPIETLAKNLGKTAEWVGKIEDGEHQASLEVLTSISRELGVSLRELLLGGAGDDPVQLRNYSDCRRWTVPSDSLSPAYEIVELCGPEKLPFSKALEITVTSRSQDETCWLNVGLHQYVYNLGDAALTLRWEAGLESFEEVIHPGDSFYMKPGVRHAYLGELTRLLVLRIGGRIGGDVLHELATVGSEHLDRVLVESMQWFDPKGRQDLPK